METILSIAIPSFNRIDSLQKTLASLSSLAKQDEIEILVVDNASDDGTWEWLSSEHENLGIKIKRNPFNFGIEGNVIQALVLATGRYIWLLSDHMFVYESEALNFLENLKGGLNFTLGYARIEQYQKVLPETYLPIPLEKIDLIALGKLMFFMGNISALIVNREYLLNCGRSLFRCSGYSYPNLGVFVHLSNDDTIVELNPVSEFASEKSDKPKRISYDTFRSRFIGFVRALEEIRRLNPQVNWSNKALKCGLLLSPLISDSIYYLCTGKSINFSDFVFCITRYPGKIRLFLILCSMLSLMPIKIRVGLSNLLFRLLIPNLYSQAMNRPLQTTSETILE